MSTQTRSITQTFLSYFNKGQCRLAMRATEIPEADVNSPEIKTQNATSESLNVMDRLCEFTDHLLCPASAQTETTNRIDEQYKDVETDMDKCYDAKESNKEDQLKPPVKELSPTAAQKDKTQLVTEVSQTDRSEPTGSPSQGVSNSGVEAERKGRDFLDYIFENLESFVCQNNSLREPETTVSQDKFSVGSQQQNGDHVKSVSLLRGDHMTRKNLSLPNMLVQDRSRCFVAGTIFFMVVLVVVLVLVLSVA